MNEIARKIRRKVIDLLYKHKAAHLGSCMSCIEILVVLYFDVMRKEDKFLLSKGWAAAALYSVLSEKGIIDWDDLYENYYEAGSKYWGLVHHNISGIEHSLGSAGHGLPVAIGMALGNRNRRVFVLLSDGEMDCGTTWESALFASHHKLDNLIAIVDYNKLQAFGRTNEVLNIEPLKDKWNSFGWDVYETDGHNLKELTATIKKAIEIRNKPHIIICHTIKGKGISFAENRVEWHYYNLTPELYEKAKNDLC